MNLEAALLDISTREGLISAKSESLQTVIEAARDAQRLFAEVEKFRKDRTDAMSESAEKGIKIFGLECKLKEEETKVLFLTVALASIRGRVETLVGEARGHLPHEFVNGPFHSANPRLSPETRTKLASYEDSQKAIETIIDGALKLPKQFETVLRELAHVSAGWLLNDSDFQAYLGSESDRNGHVAKMREVLNGREE